MQEKLQHTRNLFWKEGMHMSGTIATIVVGLILLAVVVVIIQKMRKQRKNGKTSCGCGCSNCAIKCHK